MVKQIVPLTFGPGGEQIGEAEVDFDNPTAPMTMRLYDQKDAQIMGDLIMGQAVSALSIDPQPDYSLGVTPVLPPEMRDTLGSEIPSGRIKWNRDEYEGKFRSDE